MNSLIVNNVKWLVVKQLQPVYIKLIYHISLNAWQLYWTVFHLQSQNKHIQGTEIKIVKTVFAIV